jgi:DNA-binding FadR family transcriptional regulator
VTAAPAGAPGAPGASKPAGGARLFETTQQAIRDFILRHRLKANDPLPPEGQLAQELGISRTSVREAVKALESLGVLESRSGVGLRVRAFSLQPLVENLGYGIELDDASLLELLHVRRQLEAGFIAEVAPRLTPERLRVLRSVADRMGVRAMRGQDFPEEDQFFHRALYDGVGNRLLTQLVDTFWLVARRMRERARLQADPDPVRAWEDHRRIVEALESGDGAAAGAAMHAHFAAIAGRIALLEGAAG